MSDFEVGGFVRIHRAEVLDEALISMGRAHLPHYEAVGPAAYVRALDDLLAIVIECCASKSLTATRDYADAIASRRLEAGYSLGELQTAIEVLELTLWNKIVAEVPPESLAYALGMISTSLGAIKDRIAVDYVEGSAAAR